MTLPFNLRPTLSSYLYQAYAFGILENPTIPDPLLCLNIQLQFQREVFGTYVHHLTFYPPVGIMHYIRLGLLEQKIHAVWSSTPALRNVFHAVASDSLSKGGYLYLYADYFYIPGSINFKHTHFRHELLIYHYDSCSASYRGATFKHDRIFGAIEVPRDSLVDAFASPDARGEDCASYCRGDLLMSVTPTEMARQHRGLDMVGIKAQMKSYLSGSPSFSIHTDDRSKSADIQFDRNSPLRRSSFGRNIYSEIVAYFEMFQKRGTFDFDPRVTRVLLEHKMMMGLRLVAAEKEGYAGTGNIVEHWREVQELAQMTHLQAVSAYERHQTDSLKMLESYLGKIELLETNLLAAWLAKLP